MKLIRKLLLVLSFIFITLTNSACAAKMFETEINVVFMYEDELISTGSVHQFENLKTPELGKAYIPDGYEFFGWTPYDPNTVFATDEDFNEKYIGDGKMVHYSDVVDHVVGDTVVLKALLIDETTIPEVYHYAVIAWYNKPATSGVDEDMMKELEEKLFAYLRSINVSEEDLATIVIRGYTGNVGPTCGKIMDDRDVDIMLGWGSKSNVTSTGGMPEEMILETITEYKVGEKNRTLHLLTQDPGVLVVYEWLQSEECRAIFE